MKLTIIYYYVNLCKQKVNYIIIDLLTYLYTSHMRYTDINACVYAKMRLTTKGPPSQPRLKP